MIEELVDFPPDATAPTLRTIELRGEPLPIDLEFDPVNAPQAFARCGLSIGRCFGSKSGYRREHPRCIFLPNANVFSNRKGKLWWGDLDLRRDRSALERVARIVGCRLYIVRELDGRFANAELRPHEIVSRAYWHTGGRVRICGFGAFRRRSGLTVRQIAAIANIRRSRLDRRLDPRHALEIRRRLKAFSDGFAHLAQARRAKKWGEWWIRPCLKLAGRSPFAALQSGESLNLVELMGKRAAFRCWSFCWARERRL